MKHIGVQLTAFSATFWPHTSVLTPSEIKYFGGITGVVSDAYGNFNNIL